MSDDRHLRVCTYCVMDTTDPAIAFDSSGRCNHCREMESTEGTLWFTDDRGKPQLDAMLSRIVDEGKGQEFDCILGLSGGVDSSYLALKAFEWGLRPLVVHVDAGWNSELAVANIQRILEHCGWELHTHVVNWEDMRELQVAFLRSGVANQDVPQDHAFFASLYHFATENNIRYILNGGNIATEGIFPTAWHWAAMDARNLKAIYREYGGKRLEYYQTIGFGRYYLWYPFVKRMTPVRPLNLIPFDKEAAVAELSDRIGWRSYDRKHGESLFTKFFQNYYLPTRYGYDKRKPHLSSRIVSHQITREGALMELAQPLYEEAELKRDRAYVLRKLRITDEEFDEMMNAPLQDAGAFPNWDGRRDLLKRMQSLVGKMTGKDLRVYS